MTEVERRTDFATKLGLRPERIQFINFDSFFAGSGRFLFGKARLANGQLGFIKATNRAEDKEHLGRELLCGELAARFDPSAPKLLTPIVLSHDFEILYREYIDHGVVLDSEKAIREAPYDYGLAAAVTIGKLSGAEVAESERFLPLTKLLGRWWLDDVEKVLKTYDERVANVLADYVQESDEMGISRVELANLGRNGKEALKELTKNAVGKAWFFTHGDYKPDNIIFQEVSGGIHAMAMDFEQSALTHNRVLGRLKDLGEFYARSWPNPELQKAYLDGLCRSVPVEINDRLMLIKAAIVLTAFYFVGDRSDIQSRSFFPVFKMLSEHVDILSRFGCE